jgi:hypothetical protein
MPKNRRTIKHKYNQGDFVLTTFSPVGLKINKQMFETYADAKKFSDDLGPNVTAIISRIVFNSAQPHSNMEI